MECLICHQKIQSGEQIFCGNQVECCGPGENDFSYSEAFEGVVGAIHLSCLENPGEVVKTPDMAVPESVVERSDALDIFEGVL